MPAGRSSNNSGSKLSNFHLIISSIGVLVGAGITIYQIMLPSTQPPPVNVTVKLDPAQIEEGAGAAIAKTDAAAGTTKGDGLSPEKRIELTQAFFLAALNDGSDKRYVLGNLFDGRPETSVTLKAPDAELNVLVDFGPLGSKPVSAISYTPPVSATGRKPATRLDVVVLPDGQIGAGGNVYNFTLQTHQGAQTFALPPGLKGKGLWLRIAGGDEPGSLAIGDFALAE
jgi:hypothetical protein